MMADTLSTLFTHTSSGRVLTLLLPPEYCPVVLPVLQRYVEGLLGRRRNLPHILSGGQGRARAERQAVNTICQVWMKCVDVK